MMVDRAVILLAMVLATVCLSYLSTISLNSQKCKLFYCFLSKLTSGAAGAFGANGALSGISFLHSPS